jgi:hypothetical protein
VPSAAEGPAPAPPPTLEEVSSSKEQKHQHHHRHLRDNGTWTYDFSYDKLGALMQGADFELPNCSTLRESWSVYNHRNWHMDRPWIQASVRHPNSFIFASATKQLCAMEV